MDLTDPIELLKKYVSYPSVSTDPAFQAGMDGARIFIADILNELGFEVETINTDWHPIILAERKGAEDAAHIIIYGHYDVQPADPYELWTSPPFEPTERDGRLYGRGTADNKGPVAIQITALARLLKENPDWPVNVTYLIEGEEETGSPSFPKFLNDYGDRLRKADYVVLSDTGIPNTEQLVITTGLRGLCIFELEVIGPRTDLHSGIHGGALLNPIQALAEVCSKLHTEDGQVNVPGFYDAVVEPYDWEREQLAKMPLSEKQYQDFLDIPEFSPEKGFTPFEAIRFRPTLEFNGIGGGYQGAGSKTVIPSKAFAKITCRLVPNQDPEDIRAKVEAQIQKLVPKGVTINLSYGEGGAPYHIIPPHMKGESTDTPMGKGFSAMEKAIKDKFNCEPLYIREGGSVPIIEQLKSITGLDSIMLGLFCPQDNLHAPDESFDLELIKKATEVYKAFFENLSK